MSLRPAPLRRLSPAALLAPLLLVVVLGCGSAASSSGAPAAASVTAEAAGSATASQPVVGMTNLPSATAAFPTGPVPGNSLTAPLPTDAPRVVTGLAPLPSCGGELNFEADPDISPLPTTPWATSAPAANRQAAQCLIWAWENGKTAQLAISSISDEQDEIYTLYRLVGDGTVDVLTRVKSKPDQAVTWTDATCKQLSLQGDQITPADCSPETPLN